MDFGDKIRAQAKPLSSISIPIAHYFELFKIPITFSFTTRFEEISLFCFFSSVVNSFFLLDFLGSLEFYEAFLFLYTHSPLLHRFFSLAGLTLFEQSKVMLLTIRKRSTYHFLRAFITGSEKPVMINQVAIIFAKAGRSTEIPFKISLHVLRASAIIYLKQQGFQNSEITGTTEHSTSKMVHTYDKSHEQITQVKSEFYILKM